MSRWLHLLLIWLVAFSCRTTMVTVGPLLPVFLRKLPIAPFWAGSLTGIPLLVIALGSVPAGRLADRIGPERAILTALGVLILACLLPTALNGTQLSLFLSVIMSGLGIGLAQPTLAKIARGLNPVNPALPTTLYANGLVMGGLGASLLTIPILHRAGGHWPFVFVAWGLVAFLTGVGWLFLIPSKTIIPVSATPAPPLSLPRANWRSLTAIAFAFAAQGVIFYSLATWLPGFYVRTGWTLAHAAMPLVFVSAGSATGGLWSSRLLRLGRGFRKPFLAVSLVMGLAIVGLLSHAILLTYLSALLVGTTTAVVFTLGLAAPAMLVSKEVVGRVSGNLLALGYMGSVIGPLAFGGLLEWKPAAPIIFLALVSLVVGVAALRIPADTGAPASRQVG